MNITTEAQALAVKKVRDKPKCTVCGAAREKPLVSKCKKCFREYYREYRKTPAQREYQRKYSKTPARREYQREYKREYSKTPAQREYQRKYQREYYLKVIKEKRKTRFPKILKTLSEGV